MPDVTYIHVPPNHRFGFITILQVFILQKLPHFKFYGFRTHMNIIKMPTQIELDNENR